MRILSIDTSCDETAVAVTANLQVVSNIVWSQSSLHSSFGGVFPSLAQRQHQERIDWVISKALAKANCRLSSVDCIAVTVGKGLAIALSVGVNKAKELAREHNKPLVPISHIEAHLLSPFARPNSKVTSNVSAIFPAFGLVLSGGTTILCLIKNIGEYEILAETSDDALGEALDKGARLLGLGYPGGAILEKFARLGTPDKNKLPLPLQNDKTKDRFSYSGLKTAFLRLVESVKNPSKQDIYDLSASFQSTAFDHIEKVLEYQIRNSKIKVQNLLFGGGVANNIEIKKRLRKLCKKHKIKLLVPYNKKLNGDNAGMVGVCAYLKNKGLNTKKLITKYGGLENINSVDINPRLKIE
ncbi:MAG: tRNA (adenosine(37)-N6)-threonylcarbamoyltransferase complex transferase subunit TsaD [bacterium]|nr:MAG: tRNA (adenosine(37)-N6)-threonylcarbamoyltransferase complex transferase subunit TsaD [bacterium]